MQEKKVTFGTAVTCMDGRAIIATQEWMKKNCQVQFVDTLTEPGMDGWLGQPRSTEDLHDLQNKLKISILNHGSRVVTVGGHSDCAGYPVPEAEHREAVKKACELIRKMVQEFTQERVTVIGLYSEEKWVSDSVA